MIVEEQTLWETRAFNGRRYARPYFLWQRCIPSDLEYLGMQHAAAGHYDFVTSPSADGRYVSEIVFVADGSDRAYPTRIKVDRKTSKWAASAIRKRLTEVEGYRTDTGQRLEISIEEMRFRSALERGGPQAA